MLDAGFSPARLADDITAIVVIPARDEAEALPACLAALATQIHAGHFAVLVSANNCRDGTAEIAAAFARHAPCQVIVDAVPLAPEHSSVGFARKAAMDRAAGLLAGRAGGIMLATDADARPMPDWVARCRAQLADGCDAVAGQAALLVDADNPLPQAVLERSHLEARLLRLIDRSLCLLDPLPWDPWPRHSGHWGANFAVTMQAYQHSGGIPAVPLAEDRAFFAALLRRDARIRHADDVVVHVLARRQGRAPGGMADVLDRRARTEDARTEDPLCDAALIPVAQALLHARTRAALRHLARHPPAAPQRRLARRLCVPLACLVALARDHAFGEAWARLAESCPALHPRRVAHAELRRQTRAAERVVQRLTGAPPDATCEPPFPTLV